MQKEESMTIDSLEVELDRLAGRCSDDVLGRLTSRKRAELEFHDRDRDPELVTRASESDLKKLKGNKKYYSTVEKSDQYLEDWIANNVPGKVFLDYACGNGGQTLNAARHGAAFAIGLDISPVSVENGRRRAEEEGLSENTYFVQGDCEDTGLPDNSVDFVLCSGMLHHLDLSYSFPELRRILKPGGRCLAVEALNYNPLIKLYRSLTPEMRTEWEKHHILSMKDVRFAKRFFEVENVKFWHLFSILATPFRKTPLFGPALRFGNAIDSLALRVFPLSRMAWIFTFELVKRADD